MKEFLIAILQKFGWACWLEITTEQPACTYYFGPFLRSHEAIAAKAGFIEDLLSEGAEIKSVVIKRCRPQNLTIEKNPGGANDRGKTSNLAGQTNISG
jgi:hypothetical protein